MFFPYNGKSTPIEMLERYSPIRWERTELVPDQEGAGEHRSEPAVLTSTTTDQPAYFSLTRGRPDRDPVGLWGGQNGKRATIETSVEGKEVPPNGPDVREPGETLSLISATPGGYGDPEDRAPELIERDIRKGYITKERAREVHGHEPEN